MHSYGGSLSQAGFTQGLDGTRLVYAKSQAAFAAGWGNLSGNPYMRFPGPHGAREAAAAADISGALLTSNPTIAAAVEALVTNAIGTGLTPSARLDHVALNISEDDARELEATFNTQWAAWAGNPLECDLSGRHTLHGLAAAGFRSYVVSGELLATIDWQKCPGAATRTKVALLDPRQCDRTKSVTDRNGGTWNGVAFDKLGRVRGYWLREIVAGQFYIAPMAAFVPAATSWGRPKVLLLWDLALPGMMRGMSPLVAALTPAHEGAALQEFTLAKALINASFAMTVESNSPADVANGNLNPAGVSGPAAWEQARVDFYTQNKLDPKAGVVNYMPPGDKLKFNESKTPSSTYEAFQGSLKREAAKASGNMVEDVTGDYSKTSFSASRMAQELPHRITLRRRAAILEPFYSAVRAAWMEEQLETGAIALPPGAPAFWEARNAYTACRWNGPGRASPDPAKSAKAAELLLNNHLTTHTDLLAEDGKDFETVMRRLAYEQQVKKDLGLVGMPMEPGETTTQVRDQTVIPPASTKGT